MAWGTDPEDRISPLDRFIERQQTESFVDQLVNEQSDSFSGADVDVSKGSSGRFEVEPDGYLGDEEFDEYTSFMKSADWAGWDRGKKTNYVKEDALGGEQPPDPRDVHQSRSERAIETDEREDAPLTTDPEKYASDPDRYDFPGVDSGPTFRSTFGDSLSSTKLNTIEEQAEEGRLNDTIEEVRQQKQNW